MSLKRQTFNGFFWMLSGSGLQSVLQFVVLIVLSRLLDPESFGIASAALVIISFTIILSTLGFGPALVQREEVSMKHIGTAYTSSTTLALIFGILIYISSDVIAVFFNMDDLRLIMKVMSIALLMQGIAIVSESLIQRNLKFSLMVRIQVISYLFYAIVGIILALLDFGVWALVAAYMTQLFVKSIMALYLQPYTIKFSFDTKSFKELIYFSGGYSIAKISSEFAIQGDNFIIGKFLGADALGLYSRAYQLMVTPANLIGQVLEKVLFPVMSKVQKSSKKIAYIYSEGIRLTTTFMLPTSIFLYLQSENIILLLFGEKWLGINVPFKILALSLLFRSSYKISDSLAKALNAVYIRAVIKWIYAGTVLLFTYIGHYYGLSGVAIGVSFAIILNYLLMTIFAVKLTKIKIISLLEAHIGGVIIALIFWLAMTPYLSVINKLTNNFIMELIFVIMLFVILNVSLIFIKPRIFIGDDGKKIVNKLKIKLTIFKI